MNALQHWLWHWLKISTGPAHVYMQLMQASSTDSRTHTYQPSVGLQLGLQSLKNLQGKFQTPSKVQLARKQEVHAQARRTWHTMGHAGNLLLRPACSLDLSCGHGLAKYRDAAGVAAVDHKRDLLRRSWTFIWRNEGTYLHISCSLQSSHCAITGFACSLAMFKEKRTALTAVCDQA